jgi:hypothetical protein
VTLRNSADLDLLVRFARATAARDALLTAEEIVSRTEAQTRPGRDLPG